MYDRQAMLADSCTMQVYQIKNDNVSALAAPFSVFRLTGRVGWTCFVPLGFHATALGDPPAGRESEKQIKQTLRRAQLTIKHRLVPLTRSLLAVTRVPAGSVFNRHM